MGAIGGGVWYVSAAALSLGPARLASPTTTRLCYDAAAVMLQALRQRRA
jgi:hypothetical protein